MLVCTLCGKHFALRQGGVNKFCSLHCSRQHRSQHPEMYPRRTSFPMCHQCGKQYKPTRDKQQFCSRDCANQAEKERPKAGSWVPCSWCEKQIYRIPCKLKERNFCSLRCSGYYYSAHVKKLVAEDKLKKTERTETMCLNCQKVFIVVPTAAAKRKFCCMACQSEYMSKPEGKELGRNKVIICATCKKEFRVKSNAATLAKYCSRACYRDNKQLKEGTGSSYRYIALKFFTAKCMLCDFDSTIHIHHIIPRSAGGSNDISNLVVLCPNHHAMADMGLLSIDSLKELNASRLH